MLFSQEVFLLVPTVGVSSDSRGVCDPLSDPGSRPGEGHPADGAVVVDGRPRPHFPEGLHEIPVASGPSLPHPGGLAPPQGSG